MTTVVIRPLNSPEEADVCARLMAGSEPWLTLGRTYHESLALLQDSARERYVAYLGQDLLGFIILNLRGAFVGYIQTVCVAPAARGRGIGTALIRFAEDRIFTEHPNIFMCVSSFNTAAQALYQRLGYRVVGELQDYVVAGQSEILLRKTRGALASYRPPPAAGHLNAVKTL